MEVTTPVDVVVAPNLKITEYFGNVASKDPRLSACICEVTGPCEEAYQTPGFDEYVLVLEGGVTIRVNDKDQFVEAGSGLFLAKGTRVKWSWDRPCKYVPICLPAFSPANCGREEETGDHIAKPEESMQALRALHEASKHEYLYHVAKVPRWEACKAAGRMYYPPTYKQDGFTHATADASKLIAVLNHFYQDSPEDFVCLRLTTKSLESSGVTTVYEQTAPVGDIPAIDAGEQLFPHLLGGISTEAGVVLQELPVTRDGSGRFLDIPGIKDFCEPSEKARRRRIVRSQMAAAGAAALAVGLGLGYLLGKRRA
uniref:(S)-ureidoglycine aminohydrolase cupin domain-containing protein n=1 Tax=Phaeomonas parva TaxID=124430 RepID=A0A7S1U6G1_9STRA